MLYIFYPLFDRVNTASLNTTTALLDKSKILAFIFECCIMKRLPAVGLVEMTDHSAAEFFWSASRILLKDEDRNIPFAWIIVTDPSLSCPELGSSCWMEDISANSCSLDLQKLELIFLLFLTHDHAQLSFLKACKGRKISRGFSLFFCLQFFQTTKYPNSALWYLCKIRSNQKKYMHSITFNSS